MSPAPHGASYPQQHSPRYAQQPPHYGAPHETYIVQGASRETSVNKITVPLILVCSLGAFLIGATYLATSQFADIKHAIDKLAGKVESLTGELSSRIGRVEQEQSDAKRDQWTRRDHEVWCAKAERANQALGWTCSEGSSPVARFAPQVNGWAARAKP